MFSSEITPGRRFVVVLQPGDDVIDGIKLACAEWGVEQGYLPVFLGAFSSVTLIGTAGPIEDEDAPLPDAVTHRNTEGTGSGTIAMGDDGPLIHVHVAVGVKGQSAAGYAGHLLAATVQYVTEIVLEEVVAPKLVRRPDAAARGIPTLGFD